MSEGTGRFNHQMLELARKLKEMTQADLREGTKISQPQLSRLEQGLVDATSEDVERLARVLGFPVSFFYQTAAVYPIMTPFHRKRAGLSKRIQERAESLANLKKIHLTKLMGSIEVDGDNIPRLSPEDYSGDPRIAAKKIRGFFKLPRGPIPCVVEILEDVGVFIFMEDFGTPQLEGFTLIGDSIKPLIFLNRAFPGDAERLTLAHELGHIVMHDVPTQTVEQEAWAFASEFLMPADDIIPDLRLARQLSDFADLKRKWKTSMAALIRRKKDLALIDDNQYRYLMMSMSPYRVKEPVQIPQEQPTLFNELMKTYAEEYKYTQQNMLELLCIHEDMFSTLYKENPKRLRLVR
jgi:Zn-dependent peptidase ImmA (M78 family)/transcriptional regulator with XRE-family HTH domain